MPAAVAGIPAPHDEAPLFERVQQLDERAGVEAHRRVQIGLAHIAPVVQQPEQLESAWREVDGGVGRPQPTHGLLPEQGELEPRARAPLLKDPVPLLRCVVWFHAG